MKENVESELGSFKQNAVKRLNSLWSKINKNKTMANSNSVLMEQYAYLGHMTEITIENAKNVFYFILYSPACCVLTRKDIQSFMYILQCQLKHTQRIFTYV